MLRIHKNSPVNLLLLLLQIKPMLDKDLVSIDFRAQRGSYENKKSPLCKYGKKSGHLIEKCYKVAWFLPNFKFTRRSTSQSSVQGNVMTFNEVFTDSFMNDIMSTDQEKLLIAQQLAQSGADASTCEN